MLRAFLAAAIAVLCAPAVALAHGDPASHYLETGSLYPSFEHQPSEDVELQLMGVLDAAKKAGFPIKVAIVAGEDDVSDNPEMLNKPQEYAEYVVGALVGSRVAVEAPVVIVTPAGIGVAGPGAEEMRGVRTGTTGDALARTAMTAVRDIAAKAGHPLPADIPPAQVAVAPPQGGGLPDVDFGALTPLLVFAVIFGGAAVLFELRTRLSRRGTLSLRRIP
jgi:hypothetical protein